MKLSVIMPVYNELPTIKKIIEKVLALDIVREIIIVDDFSIDGTREFLESYVHEGPPASPIRIILHERNFGKGRAVRSGIEAARSDYAIIQDGDLEYDPGEYLKLMEEVTGHGDRVVYGSRFLSRPVNMSLLHWLGNRMLTFITNILYGAKLTDMETCYKLIQTSLLKSLDLRSDKFEIEAEITAKILKRKINIKEVPINYLGRDFHQGKKISWLDGFSTLKTLFIYRFGK